MRPSKFGLFLSIVLALTGNPALFAGDRLFAGIGTQTAGGLFSWSDVLIQGDWRIQQHESFGYYRLLDPRERRVAQGSIEQCMAEFQRRRLSGEIPPMPEHVVITIHGLAGSRGIMEGLGSYLTEQGGYTVVNFGYASTRGTIQEQTVALESVIRNLEGVREISLVAHSMGCILVRHLLYRFEVQGNPPPIAFRRMVMISPPNHGAVIADTVGQRHFFQFVLGDVVDQFAPDKGWPQLEAQLATPPFEFGILAGGRGNDHGFLPRVPGDDDGLLSVQTQVLDGASAFLQVGGVHQLMPRYQDVKKATLCFLQFGHF